MVTEAWNFLSKLNFTLKTSSENITTNTLKSLHDTFIAFIKNDSFHIKEKPSLSPVCLLYSHTKHLTSDTSGHQMSRGFSPQ